MFTERLNRARNGRGVLFCGAGFSADSLNFDQDELGAGAQLLLFLNQALADAGHDSGFKEIQNAADFARQKFGNYGLMNRLKDRFTVRNVSADMVELMGFPWERIYTTNYDNAVEMALFRAGVSCHTFNNLDNVDDIAAKKVSVIHLHGHAQSWNNENFERSCILGSDSYHNTGFLRPWLDIFRQDIDRAEIIVFVGFSVTDFHLNAVLRDVTALREKLFFVNKPASEPDIDVKMTQSRFGCPLYIGRKGLADQIRLLSQAATPSEPALSSFERFERDAAAANVPTTRSIEDLFIFGDLDEADFARDVDNKLADYRIGRTVVTKILDSFKENVRIALISGDICDGKTLVVKELARRLDVERPVFAMRIPYDDLLEEVAKILSAYPNAALIIENCFDISREKLASLARQVSGSESVLVLSSRNIAAEARSADMSFLASLPSFREFKLRDLDDAETDALIGLTDQIAGWREFEGKTIADRRTFIKKSCNSSLPSFLMRLIRSKYVRDRYREEYNKINGLDGNQRLSLIAALYITHIGDRAPTSILSDVFEVDIGGLIRHVERSQNGLRLLRLRGNFVETVPSIGATSILRDIVVDRDIVEAVVKALQKLAGSERRDEYRRHIFSQMMRYSIIDPVLEDKEWVARFFDNVSKIEYIRRQVLFWLQWSIALRERGEFVDSEKKLDQAYREAEMYERRRGITFDRKQLDDVKAKFLISRAMSWTIQPVQLFRDMKAACDIVGRLLKSDDVTHHPFQTLEGIASLFSKKGTVVDDSLRQILRSTIDGLIKLAERKITMAPAGYQESMAADALGRAKSHALP